MTRVRNKIIKFTRRLEIYAILRLKCVCGLPNFDCRMGVNFSTFLHNAHDYLLEKCDQPTVSLKISNTMYASICK